MISLVGYTDTYFAPPGGQINVKVSSALEAPYHADLVRIRSADPNPSGPGMKIEPVDSNITGIYPSRLQRVSLGSYGVITGKTLPVGDDWTVSVRVQPWLLAKEQVVLSLRCGSAAIRLAITKNGAQVAVAGKTCSVNARMVERQWYELRIVVANGELTLQQQPILAVPSVAAMSEVSVRLSEPLTTLTEVVIAAEPAAEAGQYETHFNGRIEHPCVLRGTHRHAPVLDPSALLSPDLIAWWDFSLDVSSQHITDRGPFLWHGATKNLPTRGVKGAFWTGETMRWCDAPDEYAAVHFHEDDLYDCEWETDFTLTVPQGLPSGVYGVRLREQIDGRVAAEDIIPVFVTPAPESAAAPVAVVMSTYTYQIYANYDRNNYDEALASRIAEWGAYPHHPALNRQFGLSCYNHHADGSGVTYSSARRPILTMRPGSLAYVDQRGSGLRHFSADMHLLSWLEQKGIAFDVVTDEYIERHGLGALLPYQAVLTGSHPEYQTIGTMNAYRDYINGGGRLAYLGGNGFYWRVARSNTVPDVLEVRRAENGVRSWVALPGEYYHALDGTYGGLWRNNGRAPQSLVGVGFCAQGKFEGSYYRRLPASYNEQFRWLFDGIDDEILGDFGYSGGGAAGFELDRADPFLGTPDNATILCRSEAHQPHFGATLEELIAPPNYKQGDKAASLVRAEIVYFENPKGGAVFSVGSITFCGSLPWNNYENSVSTLLKNVIDRFLAHSRL